MCTTSLSPVFCPLGTAATKTPTLQLTLCSFRTARGARQPERPAAAARRISVVSGRLKHVHALEAKNLSFVLAVLQAQAPGSRGSADAKW